MSKEIAKTIPDLNAQSNHGSEAIVYCHLFGVIGDWYICGISEDQTIAFGYMNIHAEKEWEMDNFIQNQRKWGTFSIKKLQELVNENFLKELDIRFLIVRDVHWQPTPLSSLNIEKGTLNYPGPTN